jgi:hypothetical protein
MAELDRIVEVNINRGFASIATRDFGMVLLVGRCADFKEDVFNRENSVITLSNLSEAKRYLKQDEPDVEPSLASYNNNELYQALRIFFSAQGRPPRVKITYAEQDNNIPAPKKLSEEVNADNDGYENGDYDGNDVPAKAVFSRTYKRIANNDNEWYYLVLMPKVRDKCCVSDMLPILNNEFIKNIHFSVLSGDLKEKFDAEDGDLHKLLNPTGDDASSQAVGTVKNLLVLGSDKFIALGVAMELAVREGGTYNPCYMSLSPAFKADRLNPNAVTDAIENNANVYHTLAGRTVFENGRCTGTYVLGAHINKDNMGEWVDTVVFIDLMRARLQEAIFGTLKSASDARSKVPFTQEGIDLLHFAASTLLNSWVARGQLQSWTAENKSAYEITSEERASRRFDGLRYNCKLAGAINTVKINVNLED